MKLSEASPFQFQPVGPVSGSTADTIKEILKDGVPDWVRFPNEYRSFAEEDRAMHRENTKALVADYAVEDQDLFVDEKPRMVNILQAKELFRRLRAEGITCFGSWSQLKDNTAGLHCVIPGLEQKGLQYVSTIQVPYMCEWSVIKTDEYGAMTGWKYIGWRDTVVALIVKGVLTEERAHEIFGKPSETPVSRRYRRLLHEHRNSQHKQ